MGLFGGDSSTSNTKYETDQKVSLNNGGIGGSASNNSTVNIQALDGGAIQAAFGMSNAALDKVTGLATGELSAAHHTTELALNGALGSLQDSKDAYKTAEQSAIAAYQSATSQVSAAYNDAKIGDRSTMQTAVIVIGGALAAVVAIFAFKAKQ